MNACVGVRWYVFVCVWDCLVLCLTVRVYACLFGCVVCGCDRDVNCVCVCVMLRVCAVVCVHVCVWLVLSLCVCVSLCDWLVMSVVVYSCCCVAHVSLCA